MDTNSRLENLVSALEDLARSRPRRRVVVPDVVGRRVSVASHELGRTGLRITTRRTVADPPPVEGVVVAQSVRPGRRVRRGTRVTLDLSFPRIRSSAADLAP